MSLVDKATKKVQQMIVKAQPLAAFMKRVEEHPAFEQGITLCIFVAAVSSGLQTYSGFARRNSAVLSKIDDIVLGIFAAEVVIKLLARFPQSWTYFKDYWNVFDFTIVVISYFFSYVIKFSGMSVIRIIRLLRVLKLVKAFEELRILVTALLKSIPSMFYVFCLLLLLFYLYAVTAVSMFGKNDPVHFKSLQIAMVSLWRVSTFEDWTDIMYINMYGCDVYGYSDSSIYKCTDPSRHGLFAALFFCSFTVLATMIILNLFVGVILNSVAEVQEQMAQERLVREKSAEGDTLLLDEDLPYESLVLIAEDLRQAIEHAERMGKKFEIMVEETRGAVKSRRTIAWRITSAASALEKWKWFDTIVIGCIFVAAISSGLQTYDGFAKEHSTVLDVIDTIVLYIFAFEALVKLVARAPKSWEYFYDPWNVFDFVIVLMGFIFAYFLNFSAVGVIRIIRLLRVLKLVKALPELRVLVMALLASGPSMFYVLCLLMLLFYLYAVTAVTIFGKNDPVHFSSLQIAMLSFWRIATFEDWTDIMYTAMFGCDEYGYGNTDPPPTKACKEKNVLRSGAGGAIFFVTFTFLATLIVLNLFVGVILTSVEQAQKEVDMGLKDKLTHELDRMSKLQQRAMCAPVSPRAHQAPNKTLVEEALL